MCLDGLAVGTDVESMETCQDCRFEIETLCQFHELAIRGDWFGELEVRVAQALGPDGLEQIFDALAELEQEELHWTAVCCRHDLPIGTCVIPHCNDLPSFGDHQWKIADRAIGAGISLN